jgi:hypothetical protein
VYCMLSTWQSCKLFFPVQDGPGVGPDDESYTIFLSPV